MATKSPTARSLDYLRQRSMIAMVVERWNQYARVRIDLFGFIDIVAMNRDDKEIIGIQSTSRGNMNKRILKILSIPDAKYWLEIGGKIHVHGWSKKGKVGQRKLWVVDVREITLRDFESTS